MVNFVFSDSLSQKASTVKTMVGMAVSTRGPSRAGDYDIPGRLLVYSWLSPMTMARSLCRLISGSVVPA